MISIGLPNFKLKKGSEGSDTTTMKLAVNICRKCTIASGNEMYSLFTKYCEEHVK